MSNEKTQHTPEPWNTVSDPIMGTLVRQEGLILAKMRKLEGIDHEANAERIVACVNACKGIEDPERYMGEVNETFGRLYHFAQGEGAYLFKLGESISKRSIELIKERDAVERWKQEFESYVRQLEQQRNELKRTIDIMSLEIIEILEPLEAMANGTAFDKDTGLILLHWLEKIKQVTERVNNGQVKGGQQC